MPYRSAFDQRRAARAHYEANKPDYIARAREHNRRQKARVKAYVRAAKDVPCTDCGVRYPFYVMQFDHLGDKLFDIGAVIQQRGSVSMATIRKEIAKCEVVCANCHAERTHQRRQQSATTEEGGTEVIHAQDHMTLF